MNATVGQSVAKGDALAEIDSREATLAVIRAESSLSSAQSQLTLKEANAQARIESQLAIAEEKLMTAQSELVETRSLAEMRARNKLVQAEVAYQAAQETIEKSKTNAEQALERARVERDDAQADYYRNKSLHEKQLISDSNFESVEKRLKLAKTRLEEASGYSSTVCGRLDTSFYRESESGTRCCSELVEIRSWEREIAVAESKVTQAQADRDSVQKLVEAKSWEQEIAIARSAVRQAEEQLKVAREQMDAATIKSPIDGTILTRHLSAGRPCSTCYIAYRKACIYSNRR